MSPEYDEFGNRSPSRKKKKGSGKKRRRKPKKKDYTGLIIAGSVIGVVMLAGLVVFIKNLSQNPGSINELNPLNQIVNTNNQIKETKNALRQLGLAAHNVHDVHKALPSSIPIEGGSTTQSWMTHMLPYVSQPFLYEKVNINANWDASENAGVFQTNVPNFYNPAVGEAVLANGYAVAHFSGNSNLFTADAPIRFRDVLDGLSGTIMLGSINSQIPAWGDPTNSRDPANGIGSGPGQYGLGDGSSAMFTICDGSVREISADVDTQILKAISTPSGGEVVGAF